MNPEKRRLELLKAKAALIEEKRVEAVERKKRLDIRRLRVERKERARRKAIRVKERIYERETAFSWQTVFRAKFHCPHHKEYEMTDILEGYSSIRMRRANKPVKTEQDEMREEAIRWIQGQYLDGNSECEPIEGTMSEELRRRDLEREGETMRKERLEKKAAKEELKAKMKRERERDYRPKAKGQRLTECM